MYCKNTNQAFFYFYFVGEWSRPIRADCPGVQFISYSSVSQLKHEYVGVNKLIFGYSDSIMNLTLFIEGLSEKPR